MGVGRERWSTCTPQFPTIRLCDIHRRVKTWLALMYYLYITNRLLVAAQYNLTIPGLNLTDPDPIWRRFQSIVTMIAFISTLEYIIMCVLYTFLQYHKEIKDSSKFIFRRIGIYFKNI